jgi:transcriptional regulator GlxA family with amidase domain
MKRIAILAALALALVLLAVEGAAADCVATNCAIDAAKQATTPAQTGSTGAEGVTTPKLENALKELGNATEHALPRPCSARSGCTTQTKSPTPAAPCTGSNC